MEAQLWRGVAAREPDARWYFVDRAPDSEPDDVMTRAPSACIIRSISNIRIFEANFCGPDEPDEPRT